MSSKPIELQGLEFKIESDATKASKGLNALAESLKKLSRVTSGIKDISGLSKDLTTLSKSVEKLNVRKLSRLGKAFDSLANASNIKISSTISKRITEIARSAKNLDDEDIIRLKHLAEALGALGAVGNVKIPNIKQEKDHTGKKSNENTSESVEESFQGTTAITVRLANSLESVGTNVERAIIPLQQLASVAVEVWDAFQDMIEGTWRYAGEVGKFANNVAGALPPVKDLSTEVDYFADTIEGTWRYVGKIHKLGGMGKILGLPKGTSLGKPEFKALPPSSMFSMGDSYDTIEGSWKKVDETIPRLGSGKSSIGDNIARMVKTIVDKIREVTDKINNATYSVEGFAAGFLKVAHWVGIVLEVLRAIGRIIKSIFNIIKKVITAVAKVVTTFVKLGAVAGKTLGKLMLKPLTKFGETIKNAAEGVKDFINSFKRTLMFRAFQTIITEISNGLKEGIDNLYQYSKLMGTDFAKSMDKLATASLYLRNSLGAMVSPIINAVAPAIDLITDKVVVLINKVNQLLSSLFGKATYTAAKKIEAEYQKIKSHIIGIDELNIIEDDNPPFNEMFEELPIASDISAFADKLREAFESADWQELGTLLGAKINDIIDKIPWETIGEKIGYWLNAAIQTAYYMLKEIDFVKLGEDIAKMFNKIIENVDWEILGRLIIRKLTLVWDLVIGFLSEVDFGEVAKGLTNFYLGIFNELTEWLEGWDWKDLAKTFLGKVNDFFNNLDAKAVGESASNFLKTLFADFKTWLDNVDWVQVGNDLLHAINDFMEGFDFSGVVRGFFSFLGSAAKGVKDLLKPFWDGIVEWWNEHIKGDSFTQTLENLRDYLIEFVDKNVLTPFINAFLGKTGDEAEASGLATLKELGKNIWLGILQGIEDYIKDHLKEWIIKAVFGPFVAQFCEVFGIASPAEEMKPYGENIAQGLLEGILDIFEDITQWLDDNVFTPVSDAIDNADIPDIEIEAKNNASGVITAIKNEIEDAIDGVKYFVLGAVDKATTIVETVKGKVETAIKDAKNFVLGAVDKASTVVETVKGKVETAVQNTKNFILGAVDKATSVVETVKGKIDATVQTAKDFVISAVDKATPIVETAKEKVNTAVAPVKNFILGAIDKATTVITTVKNTAVTAVSSAKNFILGAIDKATPIIETIKNKANAAVVNVRNFVLGAVDKATTVVGTVKNKVDNAVSGVRNFVTGLIDKASAPIGVVENRVDNAVSGVRNFVTGLIDKATPATKDTTGNVTKMVNQTTPNVKMGLVDNATSKAKKVMQDTQTIVGVGREVAINAIDNVTKVAESIKATLDSIPKSITITINIVTVGSIPSVGGGGGGGHATGGIVAHATGGMFVRPTFVNLGGATHLFGEAGREAVLPLDSYTGWMDEVAERVDARVSEDENGIGQALAEFYNAYIEPVMAEMSSDMKRQADKNETTTVRISNRDIRNAYDTQKRADGYNFVR